MRIFPVLTRARVAATLAIGVALAATGGFAIAAESDSPTIRGCVYSATGQLRVLKSNESCRPTETPLNWNERGPAGPSVGLTDRLSLPPTEARLIGNECAADAQRETQKSSPSVELQPGTYLASSPLRTMLQLIDNVNFSVGLAYLDLGVFDPDNHQLSMAHEGVGGSGRDQNDFDAFTIASPTSVHLTATAGILRCGLAAVSPGSVMLLKVG